MSKLRSKLSFLFLIVAVLVSVPLVLGFLGAVHPALDSLGHFRAHLAALMALLVSPLLFTNMRREAAMILLLAITAFSTTLSATRSLLGSSNAAAVSEPAGARYSLIQINLLFNNPEPKGIIQMIAREKPDVVTYQEAGPVWDQWLDILKGTFPYRHECKGANNGWGVGILSRRPLAENGDKLCSADGTLAATTINFGGSPTTIASFHSFWPWPFQQPQQITDASPILAKLKGPLIIAGDFNAAPWSYAVRRIETASGTQHLQGMGPTWITDLLPYTLRPYIGLPIDQVLIDSLIEAPKVSARDAAGSDHLPVRLDFSVAPPKPQEEEPAVQAVMLQ